MRQEHTAVCLNQFLSNWVAYAVYDLDWGNRFFTFDDSVLKYPARFKVEYLVNVRIK